jgi:plasmid stability protein
MQFASLTIRRLDSQLKAKLRVRAAQRGHSMEEEARDILRHALAKRPERGGDWLVRLREGLAKTGYVELELPKRGLARTPPSFR